MLGAAPFRRSCRRVYDVGAGVINSHRHHVDVAGSGDLRRQQPRGFTCAIQSRCFCGLPRNRRCGRGMARTTTCRPRLAHGRTAGVFLSPSRCPPSRLGALGILELHNPRPLDRLFADAEQSVAPGNHVIGVGMNRSDSRLAGASKAVERLATEPCQQTRILVEPNDMPPLPGHVDRDLRPRVVAAVQHELRGDILAPQVRRCLGGLRNRNGQNLRPKRPSRSPDTHPARCRSRPSATANDQVGRPAAIAQRGERRIVRERKRLLRASATQ